MDVDILIDHGDVLVAHMGRGISPQGGGDLLGLAAIGLLYLDEYVDARLDRHAKDVGNPGHAGGIQCVPGRSGAHNRAHDGVFAKAFGNCPFHGAAEDRFVTMGYGAHPGDMLGRGFQRIIAGEFRIGAFGTETLGVGINPTLDDDLCVGGDF